MHAHNIPSLSSLIYFLYVCVNGSSSKLVKTVLTSSFTDALGPRVKTVGSEICGRHDYEAADAELLLVVVDSNLADVHKRNRVRSDWRLWLKDEPSRAQVMFFIENAVNNAMLEKTLMMEMGGNNDLVWTNVSRTDDHYTERKSASWLQWVDEHCSSARFVLKTEIDTLIHVPALMRFLRRTASAVPGVRVPFNRPVPLTNKIWGFVFARDSSITLRHIFEDPDSGYVPSLMDKMPYCSGDTFLMTGDVVKKLYRGILRYNGETQNYSPTRYLTGVIAREEHVNLLSDNRFQIINLSTTASGNASQNCYYLRNHFVYKVDVNGKNEL